jgi:hypothetical protein
MSDTNTPDDASDNQDIELPDQLTQAEFDTYIDHDQDTQCLVYNLGSVVAFQVAN